MKTAISTKWISANAIVVLVSAVLAFSLCGIFSGQAHAASTPSKTAISSVTKAAKSLTVKWKANSSPVKTGYQIRYSTDKNMKKGVKTVKAVKSATSKKLSSGVMAATTYFVQMRVAYKKAGKTKYTGWSSKKTITTLVGSGNSAFDKKIESILSKNVKKAGATGLKRAFDYVVDLGYGPYTTPSYSTPWKKWSVTYAKDMANKQKGNCYQAAALFTWLAKGLGYDARAVCGKYIGGKTNAEIPHGWTEVSIGGKTYICDPNNQQTANRNNIDKNYYKVSKSSDLGNRYIEG